MQEAEVEIDHQEELRIRFTDEARPLPPPQANGRAMQRESVPDSHG